MEKNNQERSPKEEELSEAQILRLRKMAKYVIDVDSAPADSEYTRDYTSALLPA